jgi:hypothetical protein
MTKHGIGIGLAILLAAGSVPSAAFTNAPISMTLQLETLKYKVGAPICGYLVLRNDGSGPVGIYAPVAPEQGGASILIRTPIGTTEKFKMDFCMFTAFKPARVIPGGGSAWWPVFLVRIGGGALALGFPGEYVISARTQLQYDDGTRSAGPLGTHTASLTTPELVLKVHAVEPGFAKYREFLEENRFYWGVMGLPFAPIVEPRDIDRTFRSYAGEIRQVLAHHVGDFYAKMWLRSDGRSVGSAVLEDRILEIRAAIVRGADYARTVRSGIGLWIHAARLYETTTGVSLDVGTPAEREAWASRPLMFF